MPNKINIYDEGKIVATMFTWINCNGINHTMKTYNGFSKYCMKKEIESFGKANYLEWNY